MDSARDQAARCNNIFCVIQRYDSSRRGWLLLSLAGYAYGEALLVRCLPLLAATVQLIAPQYTPKVVINSRDGEANLVLDLRVRQAIHLSEDLIIPVGQPVPASANVVHVLVPLVLFFCVVCAWPARDWREQALALAFALPLAAGVLALTAPFQLVGLIELAVQQAAASQHLRLPVPLTLSWMVFMEGGGRWVLPILAGLLCGRAARQIRGDEQKILRSAMAPEGRRV